MLYHRIPNPHDYLERATLRLQQRWPQQRQIANEVTEVKDKEQLWVVLV